jgi:hypothetical protein
MPITSFLLIPAIQGTIPAYFMAFASLGLVMASGETGSFELQRNHYLSIAFLCAGIWLLLFCGSQFGHLVSNRHGFGDLVLIRPDDTRVLFRRALFTQTTYLSACICIALFFRFFFREEWMRYVLWGAWFLALYGIYEWLFFLIFKRPGDFIANRMYGDHPGSWSQTMAVGPLSLLRIKSTFGEPSWFSASVIPYFFLALRNKSWWLCAALLFCIVFSTSTSAYLGFAFAFILYVIWGRRLNAGIVFAALVFVAAFLTLYYVYPDTFYEMFTAKFRGENDSGQSRMEAGASADEQAASFTLLNRLFGIGFGYHYGGVFFAVLMNTGWLGLLVYLYVFLKPAILLPTDGDGLVPKVCVTTLFFLFYISVSELFLPTTWMFIGLAYWYLDRARAKHAVIRHMGWDRIPSGQPRFVTRRKHASWRLGETGRNTGMS